MITEGKMRAEKKVQSATTKPPAPPPMKKEKLSAVLFDDFAVLQALDENAKGRTSAENVSDVLDAMVRLMRSK